MFLSTVTSRAMNLMSMPPHAFLAIIQFAGCATGTYSIEFLHYYILRVYFHKQKKICDRRYEQQVKKLNDVISAANEFFLIKDGSKQIKAILPYFEKEYQNYVYHQASLVQRPGDVAKANIDPYRFFLDIEHPKQLAIRAAQKWFVNFHCNYLKSTDLFSYFKLWIQEGKCGYKKMFVQ